MNSSSASPPSAKKRRWLDYAVSRWDARVGKVDNHPHLLAHVILTTQPSKAASPGKVVPLKEAAEKGSVFRSL